MRMACNTTAINCRPISKGHNWSKSTAKNGKQIVSCLSTHSLYLLALVVRIMVNINRNIQRLNTSRSIRRSEFITLRCQTGRDIATNCSMVIAIIEHRYVNPNQKKAIVAKRHKLKLVSDVRFSISVKTFETTVKNVATP